MNKIAKPIAAFDLDGVVFRGNLVSRLCEELCRQGFFTGLMAANMIELFVKRDRRQMPFRDFEKQLVQLMLVALRGKSQDRVQKIANRIVSEAQEKGFKFTSSLLSLLRRTHDCIAVTGGLRETAEGLAEYHGFEACYSTLLGIDDQGLYTGKIVSTPIQNKAESIKKRLKTSSSHLERSIAIGDSISDYPLLDEVEKPLAFNPDHTLLQKAEEKRWPVIIERKDVIYIMQCGTCLPYHFRNAIKAVRHAIADNMQLQ